MKPLPDSVAPYRRTPEFDQDSIPDALRRDHTTATGVWGLITVLEGVLRYDIEGDAPETVRLTPQHPGVVEPQVPHRVTPDGEVRFFVEFYR